MQVTGDRPTHDVILTDPDSVEVGLVLCNSKGDHDPFAITRSPMIRTAMKTTTGNQKYSDFEPPWTPIAQDDWSGGRGKEDYDDDITRFMDSKRANTMNGKIILGPQETYTTSTMEQHMPGSVSWHPLITGDANYIAKSSVASHSFSAGKIAIFVRRIGTPAADLTIEICADDGGEPGSVIRTIAIDTDDITDVVSEFFTHEFTAYAWTATTTYWIKVYSTGDADDHWEIGVEDATGTTEESDDSGSTWTTAAYDLYYRVTYAQQEYQQRLMSYQRSMFLVRWDGSDVTMYVSGDKGVADANTGALTTLIDATKSWSTDWWEGAVVLIIGGTGSDDEVPYRTIASNTGDTLTVTEAWTTEHDTTTEYAILGSNRWTLIEGHGLTALPTDIIIINDIVYFAQGDSINMRRMQWTAASGYSWAADSTNKAYKLAAVQNTDGDWEIWKGNNDTVGVAKASVAAWATDLSFGAAITFQDPWGKINALISYGDTTQLLWIMREGSVFYISEDKPFEIPLPEMHNLMETTNGQVAMVWGVYLFFNLADGLERYYSRQLDDYGPNRDEGLPSDRQGVVSDLLGYPGSFFAAIDAGDDGFSSVMNHNGTGWHEYYRAPMAGERITSIASQSIPGELISRLWISMGDEVIWLPLVLRPENDANFTYTHEGTLTSGYMYAGLQDIFKLYQSVKLFTENLGSDCTVELDYQLDEDTAWSRASDTFDTSPIQEVNLLSSLSETGKRMRYRIRLLTTDNSKTPKIKSVVVETVSRIPVKFAYSLPYRLKDNDHDLLGADESRTAAAKQAIMDAWASNLTPLSMQCRHALFDGKTVFADSIPSVPNKENSEGYINTQTLTEV